MVLTNAQTTAFFEQQDQMGVPHQTVTQLVNEGISQVEDLKEFTKDDIKNLTDVLRKTHTTGGLRASQMVTYYQFGAKSQKRMTVACELIRYYDVVGRTITAANIKWNPVMIDFEVQWKALLEKKGKDKADTPKIHKGTTVMKWSESIMDHFHSIIGSRNVPLAYVVRESDAVAAIPDQAVGKAYSEQYGSIEEELINRATHNHPLFRVDNEAVYMELEAATRNTQFAAAIAPFQRRKDGRAAYVALISQYAGNDKWEAELKRREAILHTWKWKGQSNHSLEAFITQH